MRKALFAVVLVAASFAGGAAVNGPGLRMAQAWAMGRLGLVQDVDDPGPVVGPHGDPASDNLHPSPIPPLSVDPPPADKATEPAGKKDKDKPRPDATRASSASTSSSPSPTSGGPVAPEPSVAGSARTPSPAPAPVAAAPTPEPLEPLVPFPSMSTDTPPLEPPAPLPLAAPRDPEPSAPAVEGSKPADKAHDTKATDPAPQAQAGDARGVADGNVALASLARAERPQPAATVPADPTDWAGVRRALRALGVSRYGTEGDANGRVRFHCVIPLAGRRAVGQHFEAEADDELQAARAALRRIALWQASEGNAP
jgi:hypothetical protein